MALNFQLKSKSEKVRKILLKSLILGSTSILLVACTSSAELAKLQDEPGYIAGFSDGCATVRESEKSFSTKRVRDEIAFSSDRAYQAGWRSGSLQCQHREDDFTSQGGRILGEDQNF